MPHRAAGLGAADSSDLQLNAYDGVDVAVTAVNAAQLADIAVVKTEDRLSGAAGLASVDPAPGEARQPGVRPILIRRGASSMVKGITGWWSTLAPPAAREAGVTPATSAASRWDGAIIYGASPAVVVENRFDLVFNTDSAWH